MVSLKKPFVYLGVLFYSAFGVINPSQSAQALTSNKIALSLDWSQSHVSGRVQNRVHDLLSKLASVNCLDTGPIEPCPKPEVHVKFQLLPRQDSRITGQEYQIQAIIPAQIAQTDWLIQANNEHTLIMGAYHVLKKVGYRFWHPFEPVWPSELSLSELRPGRFSGYLNSRGFSHHTMHPLEMTHVLNGWGPGGPEDKAGWEALLPEYELYLEWLVAQNQNKFEWVLLEKSDWADFSRSPERQDRIKTLVERAHAWGITIGIDAPLVLEQQNGWRLIPKPGNLASDLSQLEDSLDWLNQAGFDFITTEMGASEFHNGGDRQMLRLLNHATAYLAEKYHKDFYSKVHISSGQYAPHFQDPENGGPLNFNFLPYYADPRLGVMPHTVQIYALDDPAPTYGRQDFSDMRRFMNFSSGTRKQIWYPETAYWVNYDIHVPLFLPVYARQRMHDLWLLAQDQVQLEGQIVFSSGFEWGYWLNDLITAQAAWAPGFEHQCEAEAMRSLLWNEFAPFASAQADLTQLLLDTMEVQYRLLIQGKVDELPNTIVKRNGMAYLAGQDTWSQMSDMIRSLGLKGFQTQPDRYTYAEIQNDPQSAARFRKDVYPLILAMESEFNALSQRAQSLESQIPLAVRSYYQELADGLQMNAWRAREVRLLFDASLAGLYHENGRRADLLEMTHQTLIAASQLSLKRSADFRADTERLAGWHKNPTAYHYGYLWPAKNLYYWWRDFVQVSTQNQNPCLMNIIDPLEIALPNPDSDPRRDFVRMLAPLGLNDCLFPEERAFFK